LVPFHNDQQEEPKGVSDDAFDRFQGRNATRIEGMMNTTTETSRYIEADHSYLRNWKRRLRRRIVMLQQEASPSVTFWLRVACGELLQDIPPGICSVYQKIFRCITWPRACWPLDFPQASEEAVLCPTEPGLSWSQNAVGIEYCWLNFLNSLPK